jgi:hypothetical protein
MGSEYFPFQLTILLIVMKTNNQLKELPSIISSSIPPLLIYANFFYKFSIPVKYAKRPGSRFQNYKYSKTHYIRLD